MDKNEMQAQELDRVSGGSAGGPDWNSVCLKCGCEYSHLSQDPYPKGFYVKRESSGCHSTTYYKCPNCGYEWTE